MAELREGSRTAICSVLAHFHEWGLISDLKDRQLLRKPVPGLCRLLAAAAGLQGSMRIGLCIYG